MAFPEARDTVRIREASLVVEVSTWYRGKTNSYVVDRTSLLSMLDKSARPIECKWEDDWTEAAPGLKSAGRTKVTEPGSAAEVRARHNGKRPDPGDCLSGVHPIPPHS